MIRGGTRYFFAKDHLGSIKAVVNANTGVTEQLIHYDEFGRVLSDSNPGFQPFGFAGGQYDHQTGLVRFGVRDYDPEMGRWTAKDPILFNGRDINLYRYVRNDPVNRIDPTGKFPENIEEALECIFGNPQGLIDSWQNSIRENQREIDEINSQKNGQCRPNNSSERRAKQLEEVNKGLQAHIDEIQAKCSGFFFGGL